MRFELPCTKCDAPTPHWIDAMELEASPETIDLQVSCEICRKIGHSLIDKELYKKVLKKPSEKQLTAFLLAMGSAKRAE